MQYIYSALCTLYCFGNSLHMHMNWKIESYYGISKVEMLLSIKININIQSGYFFTGFLCDMFMMFMKNVINSNEDKT